MVPENALLLLGASNRAAAFSALRAGFRSWSVDLFADLDLSARCSCSRVRPEEYPRAFLHLQPQAPAGPWIFTGGLENHHRLVTAIARVRPLWGNDAATLVRARSPFFLDRLLENAGIAHRPAVLPAGGNAPGDGRWLIKPLAAAGGRGIQFWHDQPISPAERRRRYFQEYLEGTSCAAIFLSNGVRTILLGVNQQLVGLPWLHAEPFHYCGSVGPMNLPDGAEEKFQQLGTVLAAGCKLRGLFGVDCILRDGRPWPVEINPRYTASVELLEYATGLPALGLHCAIFSSPGRWPVHGPLPAPRRRVGKAILFARDRLVFPADGPWMEVLRSLPPLNELPPFADIPVAGEVIEAGRPIMTFFTQAPVDDKGAKTCAASLRRTAAALDQVLFRR